MSKFLLCTTFGLYLLQLCLAETQFNISCRYAGVFHVEKNRRYSLTRNEAIELCRALNSTLPTMEQMEKAHRLGFETCRYGFIEDKIVIPRIKPYFLCAANHTGIYVLISNGTERYDTYCYNASETRDQACEPIIRFDASWADNHTQIVIDNADGSRYTDGVRHTEPTPVTEDDRVGSGSAHDSDTTNPTIIRTDISDSPYYEGATPDVPSTDYSSGSGRKEYHPTSTNDIAPPFDGRSDEDSTQISLMTDDVPGQDNDHPDKRLHPTSTKKENDLVEEEQRSENIVISGSLNKILIIHPAIITADEDSLHGAHHENSIQGQQIPGFISLQRHATDHKEEHPTMAFKATIVAYEDSPHGNSTQDQQMPEFIPSRRHSADHKEDRPSTAGHGDEDSQQIITDNEDFRQSQLNHGFLPEEHNKAREDHPTDTSDLSSQDDGADDEDSTQDPLVAVISLGGDHSGDKKLHPPSTTVNPHHGAHEETSTQRVGNPSPDSWWWSTTELKEHLTTMPFDDEDSQENESADEDSLQDPLHSGWGKNDDKEDHTPVTNVDSHRDSKRIESTADPLLHNVYLGRDKDEDKYSKNTTVDSVKPAHFPGKERDHSSSVTMNKELGRKTYSPTVVVPSEGAKNEVPAKDPGWFNEVKYSTNATRNDVLPGVIPSHGSQHSTTAEVPNDYAKHEGPIHSAPSPADPRWSKEDKYPTNTTRDEVSHGLIPLSESEHKDGSSPTAVVSTDGAKHGGSTQDPPSYVDLLGWGSEDKYPTNTTKTDVQHGLVPSSESEQENKSTPIETAVSPMVGPNIKTQPKIRSCIMFLLVGGDTDKYPMNGTRDDVLPGIISPSENDQEKEFSHTAVTSSDRTIHEDSTHDSLPPDNQPGWGSEGKYPTKTSRKNVMHELIPQNENEYKDESYTAVVSNAGATHEDSTHDPLLHGVHPEWGNEDRYPTNTSRDDLLPGIIPPSETEHEKESPHTVVISNDGFKHEDSTTAALAPGIQPGRDNEDKYPTNNTRDNLIPGVFSGFESGHGRETASTITSFTSNKLDGRKGDPHGQATTPNIFSQPRSAHIPEWLIIVASLVALTLVLAVCIAVNSRRRCGQKKKLVINNGKGSVSDKKMSGLNGEASKSQEMVHLVHKEQPDNRKGTCDEFLTTDETQNQQEAGMKTGL